MESNGANSIGQIVENNMPKPLLLKTINSILKGLAKFEKLSDAALFIKEELNKFDSPTYHVMIVKDFGCSFTTELNKYLYMKVGPVFGHQAPRRGEHQGFVRLGPVW